MFTNFLLIAKQIVSATSPKIWFYSVGLYLLGVSMALALSQEQSTIPSWWFIICLLWITATGMVIGLSHDKESSKFIFPWEIIFIFFKSLLTWKRPRLKEYSDSNVKISIAISGISILLFFLINAIFLNSKILALGIGLLIMDFLYNSRYVEGKYRPYLDVLGGAVQSIPIFIGYVFITDTWPNAWLMLAGVLYCVAIEAYARVIEVGGEHFKDKKTSAAVFGKEKSLLASTALAVLCGIIFASYDVFYFLFVVPFLIVLILSLHTKDRNGLLKIHTKTFLVHSLTGFLAASYFFIFPVVSELL